jgi:hypothetical protein
MPVANFFPSPSSRSARACPLARPPARSSSSLSVLLWFALFSPVLVQNETSQVSLPFSLFLALLFLVSVFLAACFFFSSAVVEFVLPESYCASSFRFVSFAPTLQPRHIARL